MQIAMLVKTYDRLIGKSYVFKRDWSALLWQIGCWNSIDKNLWLGANLHMLIRGNSKINSDYNVFIKGE